MPLALDDLQRQNLISIAAQRHFSAPASQATGYSELDEALGGGWPETGVIEICSPQSIGELRLLLPALAGSLQRLYVFINPPARINGQALTAQEISLEHIVVLHLKGLQDQLWAAETCLASGACSNVLFWQSCSLEPHQCKRLKLASDKGNSRCFILRQRRQKTPMPIDLGLNLQPQSNGVKAHIHKRRLGFPSDHFAISMAALWPYLVHQDTQTLQGNYHSKEAL